MMQSQTQTSMVSRPKRVITEARKAQNREAQRAYRQRQKERLKTQREHGRQIPSTAKEIRPYPVEVCPPGTLREQEEADRVSPSQLRPAEVPSTDIKEIVPFIGREATVPFVTADVSPADSEERYSATEITDITRPELDFDALFPAPFDPELDPTLDDILGISPNNYLLLPPPAENDNNETDESPSHSTTTTTQHTTPGIITNPEPRRTSLITAVLHNASALGISIEQFFTYNCMSLCSPFYRAAPTSTDPKTLLAGALAVNPFMPTHLRPTLPQILIPHHPIFDLIPIPVLRSRAIILSATLPHLVNMFDLKRDILEGGLVCAGLHGGVGGGQPWDLGSWEVSPWFMRKWRLLLERDGGDFWG